MDAVVHVGRCGRPCSPIMRRTASLNSLRPSVVPPLFVLSPLPRFKLGRCCVYRQSTHKKYTPPLSLYLTFSLFLFLFLLPSFALILCSLNHFLHQSLHHSPHNPLHPPFSCFTRGTFSLASPLYTEFHMIHAITAHIFCRNCKGTR